MVRIKELLPLPPRKGKKIPGKGGYTGKPEKMMEHEWSAFVMIWVLIFYGEFFKILKHKKARCTNFVNF